MCCKSDIQSNVFIWIWHTHGNRKNLHQTSKRKSSPREGTDLRYTKAMSGSYLLSIYFDSNTYILYPQAMLAPCKLVHRKEWLLKKIIIYCNFVLIVLVTFFSDQFSYCGIFIGWKITILQKICIQNWNPLDI